MIATGLLLCVFMIGGYRSYQQGQAVDQVGNCLNTGWYVQQAENAFFKRMGRFGTREELQGANRTRKVFLLPGEGWKLDTTCPELTLKLMAKGTRYALEARPPGAFEASCKVVASESLAVKLSGDCPALGR